MHSFEVNIRICQLENSDVHQGEKNAPIVLLYDTACLSFPSFILSILIFINLLKSDIPSALKTFFFQQLLFKFQKLL